MLRAFGRPLIACTLALLAFAAAPPAHAADGLYTHVVCADPATGEGVADNGQLPTGVSGYLSTSSGSSTISGTRCRAGQPIGPTDGLRVNAGSGWTADAGQSLYLRYRAPAGIGFHGARLWRAGSMSDNWAWSIVGAHTSGYRTSTIFESCWANLGCTSRGSTAVPFGPSNIRDVDANDSGGFTAVLACHTNGAECAARNQTLRIYGGRVALRDDLPPTIVGTPSGSLTSAGTLDGVEDFNVAAGDTGAGVYRVILRVDGVDRLSQIASANTGRCADVNPANEDPYEFALAQPCSAATDGIYSFDTTALPDGEHQLVVQVEDAAGKRATAVNRRVLIDNYPPPVATAPPAISGSPRRGSSLSATGATFDDHGAPGDVVVRREWQRCRASCSTIAGVTGTTYTAGSADVGFRIRVVETATNSEGSVESASAQTARVALEDGTFPVADDERDNDCDTVVDEPGEAASCPGALDPATPLPGTGTSTVGGPGRAGRDGADGTAGARGVATSVASLGPINGENASPRAHLTARFVKGGAKGRIAYRKTLLATGRLTDESGRPIRNAVVDVAETPALAGARAAAGRPLVTDGAGEFIYRATGKAGSRSVAFLYRYQRQGAVVAQSTLALTVKAGVRLKVRLRGIVASYSGKVLAGSMPRGGKLVIVQGRATGGSWQTFASRRAKKNGTFKGKYRLKVRRPGKKLQFRVRVLSESGWNYGAVTSKAVTRKVR